MIVICEECGKNYRVDPEKIQGNEARFKKKYDKAPSGTTKSYNIKKEARAAGIDTSKW